MDDLRLENEIISSVQSLNGRQKSSVLEYIKNIERAKHSTKLHRRKAMKQIRKALENI